jgi:plastocyanin
MELQILGFMIIILITVVLLEYYKTSNQDIIVENKVHYILITDKNSFTPSNIEILRGDSLHFRNLSKLRHVINNNYDDIDNSPLLLQYDTWSLRFNNKGTFVFFSSLYDDMEKLVVKVN